MWYNIRPSALIISWDCRKFCRRRLKDRGVRSTKGSRINGRFCFFFEDKKVPEIVIRETNIYIQGGTINERIKSKSHPYGTGTMCS